MKVLITGGLGYIGSHTCVELLNEGNEVIIIDNLVNSKIDVLDKIEIITSKKPKLYVGDCCNKDELRKVFEENKDIDAVIHLAGYKTVSESVLNPIKYYENNIINLLSLLDVMKEFNCERLIFSSSATVYGLPQKLPINEFEMVGDTKNPYASTKYFAEVILRDFYNQNKNFSIIILRYFNPIGAHYSMLIGDSPNYISHNIIPDIMRVVNKEISILEISGNDPRTKDGTGVRDYVHVMDIARGNVLALKKLMTAPLFNIYNLGSGNQYSVIDLITTFEKVNNVKIDYRLTGGRLGNVPAFYSDSTKAFDELGWKAEETLETMCKSAYGFASNEQRSVSRKK